MSNLLSNPGAGTGRRAPRADGWFRSDRAGKEA